MVAKGQFLERPTLIPVGEWVLEGLSHRGSRAPLLLVIPPQPDEGGGMDHLVAAELAYAASAAGYPCLRFNFRGIGASQGPRSKGEALIEDALAALEVGAENADGGPVLLASINGSDAIALELYRRAKPKIAGVCLISPMRTLAAAWPEEVWVIIGSNENAQSPGALSSPRPRTERILGADRTWSQGLGWVGKAVVKCLAQASEGRGTLDLR